MSTDIVEHECLVDIRMPSLTFVSIAEWMQKEVDKLKKSGQLKELKEDVDIPTGEGNLYT